MRALGAAWVTGVLVAGCGGGGGDGLVIVLDGADTAAGGRDVVELELFVGRTGPDARFVRDYDPERDLFTVSMADLPGYRLFLRADVVPTDLEAVAIVGYDGDPDAGGVPLVFGVVDDPPFADGVLTEVTMEFTPIVDRGQAAPTDRWIERWGAAPIEPVAAHACLAWGSGASAVDASIVRADDLDCDGTVPPSCDPMQLDPLVLEGADDVDGDGYGAWTTRDCEACLVQDGEDQPLRAVACDCDEQNAAVHFAAPELCDGVDNDCDGALDGNYTGQRSLPCQIASGTGDCSMGVHSCTETAGVVDDSACGQLPASHVSCIDLSACVTPRDCELGGVPDPSVLSVFHCAQNLFLGGPAYCGVAPVAQFFAALAVPAPVRCSATVWGGDDGGWKIALVDGATGDHDRSLTDVDCATLAVVVEESPATNGAHTLVLVTLADAGGTPLAVVPVDMGLVAEDGGCLPDDTTICTPPQAN